MMNTTIYYKNFTCPTYKILTVPPEAGLLRLAQESAAQNGLEPIIKKPGVCFFKNCLTHDLSFAGPSTVELALDISSGSR